MQHRLSITINGQPREAIALAAAEPLANVVELTLEFDRDPTSDSIRFLRTFADATDYSDGAYHFRRWRSWPATAVGVYRGRGVVLRYADGDAVEAPLHDEIIVEVKPAALSEVPLFTAR